MKEIRFLGEISTWINWELGCVRELGQGNIM